MTSFFTNSLFARKVLCFLLFSSLFFSFSALDRLFLKKNHGFCLHYIYSNISPNPSWHIPLSCPVNLLSQPFSYLGKGAQNFVFSSQDNQYVLKFYRFPSHMRPLPWLKHPLAYRFSPKRIGIKKYNEEMADFTYHSYYLAAMYLPEETGVVYLHLNPTTLHQTTTLIDKLKASYTISLDPLGFVLQKKGTPFFPTLLSLLEKEDLSSCTNLIDSLFDVISSRCQKGISDLDDMKHNNYGILDNKVIHLDIGRFVEAPHLVKPQEARKEIERISAPLKDLLEKKSPSLFSYYEKNLDRRFPETP